MPRKICIHRQAALANSQSYYRTGAPCKRGHMADRYVHNGDCVKCLELRRGRQPSGRTAEQNRQRNERLAQQRREMRRDDTPSTIRRALMGLGHTMQAADAQERSARLNAAIKAGANFVRQGTL
jgi:hypothetical protein